LLTSTAVFSNALKSLTINGNGNSIILTIILHQLFPADRERLSFNPSPTDTTAAPARAGGIDSSTAASNT